MKDHFLSDPLATERWRVGPLAPHVDAFERRLQELGYARSTRREKLRLVAEFDRWLGRRKLLAADVDEQIVVKYLERCGRPGDSTTLGDLIEALREAGVASRPTRDGDETQLRRLEREFGRYLAVERGLSQATLKTSLPFVRSFLVHRFGVRPIVMDDVRAPDVARFLLGKLRTVGPSRAKLMVGALRSFFRFLRWRGDIAIDLASSVPKVADWRLSALPKSLPADEVERLIRSCDRGTVTGQRDYTLLLLLARLGLRAGEIVAMTLDDIDWEAGELTVRGKGGREDRLPISREVGQAMATYLRQGRPQDCYSRRFFIRRRAPRRGFASSVAVCTIVRRALERAGITSPRKGAHLLRHSLATEMLRKGASLVEIGEILRHRSMDTTAIYAKVDLVALRALAQPWPSGGEA
ncbi:MAG: site-specific integrase [Planctomycetota bacterium]|jgi:site-specific recombinase XerD